MYIIHTAVYHTLANKFSYLVYHTRKQFLSKFDVDFTTYHKIKETNQNILQVQNSRKIQAKDNDDEKIQNVPMIM